jgi:hypothetical protein
MGLNINLRGDLAKLGDDELAERLKEAWRAYEEADGRFHWWQPRWWLLGRRGPIRHPRAYQFLAALQATDGGWLNTLFATVASHKDAAGFVRRFDRTAGMHVSICEIHDMIEEIERRLDKRQDVKT